MSALAELPMRTTQPDNQPAYFCADERDHQRANAVWFELVNTGGSEFTLYNNCPIRSGLVYRLLLWFVLEGRDTVIEPFWASKLWDRGTAYVQAVMRELTTDGWVIINKQFGQVSSYGLTQKLQAFLPDPMDMDDAEDNQCLEKELKLLQEDLDRDAREKARADREEALISFLGRITLIRGQLPHTNGNGAWDERTSIAARALGIKLPALSTYYRYFGPFAQIHEKIHAWIEHNQ